MLFSCLQRGILIEDHLNKLIPSLTMWSQQEGGVLGPALFNWSISYRLCLPKSAQISSPVFITQQTQSPAIA